MSTALPWCTTTRNVSSRPRVVCTASPIIGLEALCPGLVRPAPSPNTPPPADRKHRSATVSDRRGCIEWAKAKGPKSRAARR
ncbi:hypothetical protein GUJ93_ZPchr0010g8706 [Zizania palustris]|uniref:Uncharacterized protein n=1 Tax=Zizania palustris TaxID=103762 RepID=A0A8J5WDV9_ZIZPA|nr:hypothetical protein GUJ93_ZPchr0010g8706 [Zizania palustris]